MTKGGVLGAPQANGYVVEIIEVKQRLPNHGVTTCALVRLIKNNLKVLARIPSQNGKQFVDINDKVRLENWKGKRNLPGVKCKIVSIGNVSMVEYVRIATIPDYGTKIRR